MIPLNKTTNSPIDHPSTSSRPSTQPPRFSVNNPSTSPRSGLYRNTTNSQNNLGVTPTHAEATIALQSVKEALIYGALGKEKNNGMLNDDQFNKIVHKLLPGLNIQTQPDHASVDMRALKLEDIYSALAHGLLGDAVRIRKCMPQEAVQHAQNYLPISNFNAERMQQILENELIAGPIQQALKEDPTIDTNALIKSAGILTDKSKHRVQASAWKQVTHAYENAPHKSLSDILSDLNFTDPAVIDSYQSREPIMRANRKTKLADAAKLNSLNPSNNDIT
jgi:hypothetical protein